MDTRIYKYWESKGGLWKQILDSGRIQEQMLLGMMPNNYKKMHGLPMCRRNGQRKLICKRRQMNFMMAPLFVIIEDCLQDIIPERIEETFNMFAKVDEIDAGVAQ